ncbi:DUF2252 domain-containing protein [Burkholderia alba]|uniref:DUF2252 domain-containing protein n=1 Tax=Burkholderia alba TaxID=2683677 RepID=UPI002B0567AA|nr:DUF2252 domain-containing protein [Burkholderia alba]
MKHTETVAERRTEGRAARSDAPRRTHAHPGSTERDPLALLERSSAGRVAALVPLRYGRMLASPFTFFRGSAIIQAHDLAGTPNSGLHFQICGDAHLMNFGGFATPERALLFDLNDFDETAPGPWEWDLKRLVASFAIAARHLGHGDVFAAELVHRAVRTYQYRIDEYARMGVLDLWYERITFDRMAESVTSGRLRERIQRGIERASRRTHETVLPKLASMERGTWRIRDTPPAVFHVFGKTTLFGPEDDWLGLGDWRTLIQPIYRDYLGSLAPDRAALLSHFRMHDLAFKVVGVGSVGTRCLILLLTDPQDGPLFLQFKEASQSVVSMFFRGRGPKHQGHRVVAGQRLMQAASDPFLGWTSGPFGRSIYGRQLRDMKISAQLELFDRDTFRHYAQLCGWALARAHAKAGGCAPQISGYLGRSERMADALSNYAMAYADQVERDYEIFRHACRTGRLDARTDADMAADFGIG